LFTLVARRISPSAKAGNAIVAAGVAVLAISALLSAVAIAGDAPSDSKIRIAFVGDSIADGYWEGVNVAVGRDACLRSQLDIGRFAKNSTGLTRPDRFDWAAELRRVAESYKPHLFVMSLGLNDRQSVVEHGLVTLDDSPLYADKYKGRVTAVLQGAADAKAGLMWIGLPSMRTPASDKDARDKNRLFEEAIEAFGAPDIKYIEPWKLASGNDDDAFVSYAPDPGGHVVQIRTSDGEHFTVAGEVMTAAYLLPRMLATVGSAGFVPCARSEVRAQ
jgi:hypothetical protein